MARNRWSEVEAEVARWMQDYSETAGLTFSGPYQAIPGFPFDGPRGDGVLTDGENLLALEVEASQPHPDTNVGKYWLLVDHFRAFKRVVLVHVWTPAFTSYGWRKRIAEFYVERMQGQGIPIDYVSIDQRQAESVAQAAKEVLLIVQDKAEFLFKTTRE